MIQKYINAINESCSYTVSPVLRIKFYIITVFSTGSRSFRVRGTTTGQFVHSVIVRCETAPVSPLFQLANTHPNSCSEVVDVHYSTIIQMLV